MNRGEEKRDKENKDKEKRDKEKGYTEKGYKEKRYKEKGDDEKGNEEMSRVHSIETTFRRGWRASGWKDVMREIRSRGDTRQLELCQIEV